MRIINSEVEERIVISLNKTFKSDMSTGIMTYGEKNDYPHIIEKLILSSPTGKACASIYSKYLAGDGFENEEIGKISVGKDIKGKDITLNKILRYIATSTSYYNGSAIHCNMNAQGIISDVKMIPFKNCRYSREDDRGVCGKVGVWSKWHLSQKPKVNEITWYHTFNNNGNVILKNIESDGGIYKFKGQVYMFHNDDSYLYPISPFDTVYLDLDTENKIQIFKNNQINNGFSDKIILIVDEPETEEDGKELVKKVQGWMGADGENVLVFGGEFQDTGELLKASNYKIDTIKTNINDKLFENWEKSIPNNIRKSAYGIPAVLIDYEQGQLSQASGEMLKQASGYYNKQTKFDRENISECIGDIFSNFNNDILRNNTNWNIKPLTL